MGSVAESGKDLFGPERYAMIIEIGSAILRGLFHEEEKARDSDSVVTMGPFDKEYREKFADIFAKYPHVENQDRFIEYVLGMFVEMSLLRTVNIKFGKESTRYALTAIGRETTRTWFKKNGTSGFDPHVAGKIIALGKKPEKK